MTAPRKPCKACPWRVGAKATDIPNFDLSLAKALCTKRYAVMACHETPEKDSTPCAGWMLRVGIPAMNQSGEGALPMRLMFRMARIKHVNYASDGIALHETADEMRSAIVDSALLAEFTQLEAPRRKKLLREMRHAHLNEQKNSREE